jgi:predicted N-acyltransferase
MMIPHGIQILKSIDKIGKIAVDSIADDGFFTYGYFKTVEATLPSNIVPFYFSVSSDEDEINAVAPCFLEAYSDKLASNAIIRKVLAIGDKTGFFPDRLLNCYSPNSLHSKILTRADSNDKNSLDAVLNGIDVHCKKERISFSCFQYVSEFDKPLIDRLENFGYIKLSVLKTLYLDVQWGSFEDYLKEFERIARRNIKREITRCGENGVTILEEDNFGKISEKFSDLQTNLFSKYNNGAKSPYSAAFIEMLSENSNANAKVFTAWKDGKLMGFSLSLLHHDMLDVYFCGFDYENHEKNDYAYFNLVYYEPIKLAIKLGLKRIHFRIGAETAKLRRGCKEENTYLFIKCQNTLFRPLFNFTSRKKMLNMR